MGLPLAQVPMQSGTRQDLCLADTQGVWRPPELTTSASNIMWLPKRPSEIINMYHSVTEIAGRRVH